jgi:MFS family permease
MAPGTLAAGVLALALLGDSLLYAVLPAHADAFGLSTLWVGLLLSINRFVRLGFYAVIARVFARLGERRLVIVAAAIATVTTAAYAVGGPVVLLVARMAWGLSFAVLSLASMSYAASGTAAVGRSLGVGRALGQIGPVVSLVAGSWLVGSLGPRAVFALVALGTLLAVPLACALPERTGGRREVLPRTRERATVTRRDLWLPGTIQLAEAAVMTALAALLLDEGVPGVDVVGTVAWILVGRRVAEILLGPSVGRLADAWPPARLVTMLGATSALGLILVAAGHVVVGACVLLTARASLATVGPLAVLAQAPDDPVAALGRWSTWSEAGTAAGPLLAGLWCTWLGPSGLVLLLAVVVVGHTSVRARLELQRVDSRRIGLDGQGEGGDRCEGARRRGHQAAGALMARSECPCTRGRLWHDARREPTS